MSNKKRMVFGLAAVLAVLLVAQLGVSGEMDSPGKLTFKAHNQSYKADGTFSNWYFTKVEIPDGDLTRAMVEFEIDLASVSERSAKLAAHLRTSDFFNIDKYLTATVKIDRVKSTDDGGFEAVATVSLHGNTAEVPVMFKVVSESPLKIDGSATLSREAFGIGRPHDSSNPRSIVDEVTIGLEGVTVTN